MGAGSWFGNLLGSPVRIAAKVRAGPIRGRLSDRIAGNCARRLHRRTNLPTTTGTKRSSRIRLHGPVLMPCSPTRERLKPFATF